MNNQKQIDKLQCKIDELKEERSMLESIDQRLSRFDPNIESLMLSPDIRIGDSSTLLNS